MKLFCFLFGILVFGIVGSIYASTLSGDLLEIQNKIGTGYSNGYVDGNNGIIFYYDISRLDLDIKRKKSDWEKSESEMPENSIQMSSKEKGWKKQNFLDFVDALKTKNTKKAVKIYEKYANTISPFLPTCCSFSKYIAHKALKNGILSLVIYGNGLAGYKLAYTFYKNGVLYQIEIDTELTSDVDDSNHKFLMQGADLIQRNALTLVKNGHSWMDTNYNEILKSWFNNPSKNLVFEKKYNQFLKDMTKIWK